MADNLAKVNRAIEEHHTIREHLKLVGDSVSDLEAMFTLQRARPEWILSPPEALMDKSAKLLQTLAALEEGLKNHFNFEERLFPPLLGNLLMKALLLEHGELKKLLEETRTLAAKLKSEGLNQRELLSKKTQIQRKVEDILRAIEEHASKEETILKMLKKALEAKG